MGINRPADCAWPGAGGEASLQVLRVDFQGRRYALGAMGAGRAKSPSEWSTGDTVAWREKAQCLTHAKSERDATGERSVSLAKMVLYYNTHLAEHAKQPVSYQRSQCDGSEN